MKKFILIALTLPSLSALQAQKYYTKNANLYFNASSPATKIEATNKAGTFVLDSKTGVVAVSLLVKGFTFSQSLMQQHFNESYIESDKYPKAEYKGTITNNADIKYSTNGIYNAKLSGKLTMHGITNEINNTAVITVANGVVTATTSFTTTADAYKINIPAASKQSIGKTITITANTNNLTLLK